MLAIARITSKGQTTIPRKVRRALHVGPGDLIAWKVGPDGTATIRRVQWALARLLGGEAGEGASEEE